MFVQMPEQAHKGRQRNGFAAFIAPEGIVVGGSKAGGRDLTRPVPPRVAHVED